MKIGIIGLGKLGLPMALGFAYRQHKVIGYDKDEKRMGWQWFKEKEASPDPKKSVADLLKDGLVEYGELKDVLECDITFVAVETPNQTGYDGTVPIPRVFMDYNLYPLRRCLDEIAHELFLRKIEKKIILCVISTVLPGTFLPMLAQLETEHSLRSQKKWKLSDHIAFVHNPQFCAMGTVIPDLYDPEFVVLGYDGNPLDDYLSRVCEFYSTVTDTDQYVLGVDEACMVKTCYNGWITSKIDYANAMMELAYKVQATVDVDKVTGTLAAATKRLWNGKRYTYGGMGDGGGCLPAGELIYTIDGMQPINELGPGSQVLTADGTYHEVTEKYKRRYNGELYMLYPRGLQPVTVTEEHPVLVADDLRKVYYWQGKEKRDGAQKIPQCVGEPYYLPASDITRDHYILFPRPKTTEAKSYEVYEILAGYYLSEGSIEWPRGRDNNGRISFHFHQKEVEYHKEVSKLLFCFNDKSTPSKTQKKNCATIRFNDTYLANKLDNDFGHGAATKRLPDWVLNGSEETARNILRGLYRGDGAAFQYGYTYSTTSVNLAYGAHLLLKRLGISSWIKEHPRRFNGIWHKKNWDVAVTNARDLEAMQKIVEMPNRHKMQAKRYNHIFEKEGFFYHKIRKVEVQTARNIDVYNLEVDGEPSYVTVAGAVHNCHPKENLALAYLADRYNLSFNWWKMNMLCRERQTEWLADVICAKKLNEHNKPIVLCGMEFKSETNLLDGSSALLLADILMKRGHLVIRMFEQNDLPENIDPAIFVITCDHEKWTTIKWPQGSLVIDPFRYIPEQEGVNIIRLGGGARSYSI